EQVMSSTPQQPPGTDRSDTDLDLEAVREVEAAVTRLAERFARRDPHAAAALQREIQQLRDHLAGNPPSGSGLRGSLHRLRGIFDSAVAGGLYEEAKDASLLILLNRILGV
ncbi:MAG TPA: hypothetical protein VF229_03415, partial [Burkholderiaceae bacterium]